MLYRHLTNTARSFVFLVFVLMVWGTAAHAAPFAYITQLYDANVSVIDTATNNVFNTS